MHSSRVEQVVERGWRRRLLVLAVDQSALALAVVFGGLALLIILGTEILTWPWQLAIVLIGAGLTVAGVRRRMAGPYAVAQMMDQSLALNDSLSTAWFLNHQASDVNPIAATYQIRIAEELAGTADLAAAFPFQRQRAWLLTACLFAFAAGLFSARYLVTRDLSLQHTFLPLAVTQVVEYVKQIVPDAGRSEHKDAAVGKAKSLPPGVLNQAAERLRPGEKQEQGASTPTQQAKGGTTGAKSGQAGEQTKEGAGPSGDAKPNGTAEGAKSASAEAGKQAPGANSPQGAKQQDGSSAQKSESLADRMRDALSSVMAKIKPSGNPESQAGSQKSSEGRKNSEQAASKDQGADSKNDSGKEQSATEQSSGQQQGQGAAKAQASGKDSAQSSAKKGSDSQSGVGHSDGDKDVKAAEQAKAMGKLAEIIGKRSATLTGDMQVEPSGKQRLQTAYTNQQGQHTDSGGEINRDEVPVEDQEYVREYMESVRKDSARKRALAGTTSH